MPQHSNPSVGLQFWTPIGVPEEEDKKKGHEKIIEEIIIENSPKMGK